MQKIIKLESLLYLTIFLLPMYLWRFSFSSLRTNMLDVLLLLCVFFGAVSFWKNKEKLLFWQENKKNIFLFVVIFLGMLVSVLANKNYAVGFGMLKSWLVLPFLFALVLKLKIKKENRENIFFTYYFSAFFVAVLSFFVSENWTYDGRFRGIFNSPNYLAMYLAPAFFVFPMVMEKLKRKNKIIALISLIMLFLGVYFTYSYACWLAVLGAYFFVAMFQKKVSFRKSGFVLALLLCLVFLQINKSKFADLINFDDRSSFSSRIMIWNSTEKMLRENWFLGIGLGNFQDRYLENQKYFAPYLEWAVPHPHNLYLTFWLYSGIFGFVGFLFLLYSCFQKIFKEKQVLDLNFRLVVLGILSYILLHGIVDTTYFKNDLAVIFWMLLVLV